MDTKHKRAIQSILEGLDIKAAAQWEGLLPDTLVKYLTSNFQITGNSSVKESKLYESFLAYKRINEIDERIQRIRSNISSLLSEGSELLKTSGIELLPKMLNLLSGIAKTSEIELGSLLMESIKLSVTAEFYKESLK